MLNAQDIAAIVDEFAPGAAIASVEAIGSGHIHATLRVTLAADCASPQIVLQRIHHGIFPDVPALMRNMERVTEHIEQQLRGHQNIRCRALRLLRTQDGTSWLRDANGQYWRAFDAIPHARTFDTVASPAQAFQAAKAFGEFLRMLSSLPPPRLHDTIPGFHHTPSRFAALRQAIAGDGLGRAATCQAEIEFALEREPLCRVLIDAGLPERLTHNDTKLNNVLFDEATGEGICVIDLDTVMPGLAPYDFGDMVRTSTCNAAEDEPDLTRVRMNFELFEALLRGFLSSAGKVLTRAEKLSLAQAGQLITLEQGVRFLADHLRGDTYYRVQRAGQNLERCRTQFQLLRSMEEQQSRIDALVAEQAES